MTCRSPDENADLFETVTGYVNGDPTVRFDKLYLVLVSKTLKMLRNMVNPLASAYLDDITGDVIEHFLVNDAESDKKMAGMAIVKIWQGYDKRQFNSYFRKVVKTYCSKYCNLVSGSEYICVRRAVNRILGKMVADNVLVRNGNHYFRSDCKSTHILMNSPKSDLSNDVIRSVQNTFSIGISPTGNRLRYSGLYKSIQMLIDHPSHRNYVWSSDGFLDIFCSFNGTLRKNRICLDIDKMPFLSSEHCSDVILNEWVDETIIELKTKKNADEIAGAALTRVWFFDRKMLKDQKTQNVQNMIHVTENSALVDEIAKKLNRKRTTSFNRLIEFEKFVFKRLALLDDISHAKAFAALVIGMTKVWPFPEFPEKEADQ